MRAKGCIVGCCGKAAIRLCVDRDSGESVCDWVGTNVVNNISGTSVGAAAQLFVKNVYAEEELVTCANEWTNQELGAEDTLNPLVHLERIDR